MRLRVISGLALMVSLSNHGLVAVRRVCLILFAESLEIGFAIRIEEFLAALPPRLFEFGRRDVPVRTAFPGHRAQVLAKFLQSWPAKEPVAVVDFIHDETGLEDDCVRDHRVVSRVGVFGDVEILLNHAPHVGEKRPVRSHSAAIFVRLGDTIGADRDKPAIANLHLRMEINQPFGLPAVLGAVPSTAEDQNMGCWPCSSESFLCFPVWSESS